MSATTLRKSQLRNICVVNFHRHDQTSPYRCSQMWTQLQATPGSAHIVTAVLLGAHRTVLQCTAEQSSSAEPRVSRSQGKAVGTRGHYLEVQSNEH